MNTANEFPNDGAQERKNPNNMRTMRKKRRKKKQSALTSENSRPCTITMGKLLNNGSKEMCAYLICHGTANI